jgi:polar amino acid transport system substrate-binding protein
MKDPNSGDVKGTFVDAIREIGSEMGVKVSFIEVDLAQFASGLQSRLYDVSIGPTFRTISRAKAVAFTNTIFYLGYDGVVKQGRGRAFSTENDVDRTGVKVAVKAGSAIDIYARTRFTHATVVVLSGTDLTLPLQAVSSGQADIGLMNEHTVEYYARGHSDVAVVLKADPIQIVGMSWAVRPDDQKWLNFLNTSLEALIATGQMASWEKAHYGRALRRSLVEPIEPSVR